MSTSPRVAKVLTGPAGSGKTRTLAQAAQSRGPTPGLGDVIGITTAQSAANELAAAGVPMTMNSSKFLGHVPGQRGKLGVQAQLRPGSLIIIDEASMMSPADLADIVDYVTRHGHKVVVCGYQEQLRAVEGGGAMMLLAEENGYVQLAYPVRFAEPWEGEASLGLRRGDAAAISEYAAHGRIAAASLSRSWKPHGACMWRPTCRGTTPRRSASPTSSHARCRGASAATWSTSASWTPAARPSSPPVSAPAWVTGGVPAERRQS